MDIAKGIKTNTRRMLLPGFLAAGLLLFQPGFSLAQDFSGPFEGMQNSDEPIQIEADRLEVKDKEGTALFTGNVNVVQGTTILKAARLKVIYAKDGEGANGNLEYLEATGTIAVRSGDQKVTAERGEFDMKKQTVRLSGDVVITQGRNVVTGCILEVDLETSSAVLKPCKGKRPSILFSPKN
ncbi:MAG: LPS ABC transporter substrate-binding protein LptA [Rhizobiaceae bacterium]|nr:LPS ABC transporter substrate-binding protein LptA [Rhizobiaceae bacterium]